MGDAPAQIPKSFGHELRVCLRCRLVKTYYQFRDGGCEMRPFFKMEDDHELIVDVKTPNFNMIHAEVGQGWLRIGRFAPSCYTLPVSEALPEEMQWKSPGSSNAKKRRCSTFRPNTFEAI